ncbi:MAG TPA: hypothetical protein VLB84_17575 [Bacteroidia bacterium]|jgi:hypothetical protein|nr:hypothetical protein [Bacteroidia bacterium]
MNILFPNNPKPRLTNIVDRVHQLLSGNCTAYDANLRTIHIATSTEVNIPWAELGFGISKCNYRHNNDLIRVVAINEENCINAELTDNELKAILLHELGHLLNHPILQYEPNFAECANHGITEEQLNKFKLENRQRKELFADAYAKRHGFHQETIDCFRKFHNLFNNEVFFDTGRVEALNGTNVYNGYVNPIDRNGF